MSIRLVVDVLDLRLPASDAGDGKTVSGRIQKLVLLRLADHANDDGSGTWPSLRRLAAAAMTDERTARRALRILEADGLISVAAPARRGGSRGGRPTEWTIDLATLSARADRGLSPESTGDPGPTDRGSGTDRPGTHPLRTTLKPSYNRRGSTDDHAKRPRHPPVETLDLGTRPPTEDALTGLRAARSELK